MTDDELKQAIQRAYQEGISDAQKNLSIAQNTHVQPLVPQADLPSTQPELRLLLEAAPELIRLFQESQLTVAKVEAEAIVKQTQLRTQERIEELRVFDVADRRAKWFSFLILSVMVVAYTFLSWFKLPTEVFGVFFSTVLGGILTLAFTLSKLTSPQKTEINDE